MKPLFEFQNLTVRNNGHGLLQNLNFIIPDAGLTVVAGASGAGKSTLRRCCNRLEVPSSGTLLYLGKDISALDPLAHRRSVAMVFQHPAPFPGSVFQNLQAGCPELPRQDAEQLCQRVGLNPELLDREADSLSGGEAQRMILARALATRPSVLLADEPTSALDDAATRQLEGLATSLVAEGIPVVWVTHDRPQIWRLAQNLVVLRAGELVFSGSPQDPNAESAIDESWFNEKN